MEKTKKIVLLMHNGGRLGNQLWWMAAFYAYCLEKGYFFDVRCFFEYQEYFNIKIESFGARLCGKVYYFFERVGFPKSILRDIFYGLYTLWSEIFAIIKSRCVIFDLDEITQKTFRIFLYKRYKTMTRIARNILLITLGLKKEEPFSYSTTHNLTLTLLPPSTPVGPVISRNLRTYFYGWLFRNPAGIIKYQKEIREFFTPKLQIDSKINSYINHLRKSYKHVVGVHIRLGDAVNEYMNNDKIAYSEEEVYTILKEYLVFSNNNVQDTCFVICSDGVISESSFKGLNVMITHNNPVEDLWLLSKTDSIIGADSSFAITASLFGNIPFIVFKRGIDWVYYKDKKGFFVNKYVSRFIY